VARAAGRARSQRFRATSAQKRTSHQERRARREPNFGWRPVRAARRSSRTADSGRPPYAEVAFSGIKGGGSFWILQSRRSEYPHGGNCTERHRARTHCETSNARRAYRIYADLRGYAQGKQGVFDTDAGDGRCVKRAGLAAWTRLITGTDQGTTGEAGPEGKLLASAAVRRRGRETKACSR
jgi:hypothetical protein